MPSSSCKAAAQQDVCRVGPITAGALACVVKNVRGQLREPLLSLLQCQVTSVAGSGAFLGTDFDIDDVELYQEVVVRERRGDPH